MTRTYKFILETGFVNCVHEEEKELEFPDDATEIDIEEELQELYEQWTKEFLEGRWERVN